MKGYQHLITSIFLALIAFYFLNINNFFLKLFFLMLFSISSLLPDADINGIIRYFKPLFLFLKTIEKDIFSKGHRKKLHTIYGIFLLSIITATFLILFFHIFFNVNFSLILLALSFFISFLGAFKHLLEDFFSDKLSNFFILEFILLLIIFLILL